MSCARGAGFYSSSCNKARKVSALGHAQRLVKEWPTVTAMLSGYAWCLLDEQLERADTCTQVMSLREDALSAMKDKTRVTVLPGSKHQSDMKTKSQNYVRIRSGYFLYINTYILYFIYIHTNTFFTHVHERNLGWKCQCREEKPVIATV